MPRSPWPCAAMTLILFFISTVSFTVSFSHILRSNAPGILSLATEILLLRLFRKAFLTTLNTNLPKARSFMSFSKNWVIFVQRQQTEANTNTLCCSVVALEEVMCYILTKLFFFGWDGQMGREKNSRHEVYFCCQPLADNPDGSSFLRRRH